VSYLVLARKYRPEHFQSVSGQEHVTRTLGNAITRDQVGHAYVFTGPRGVGKTSIARIFAKCLNCSEGPTLTPCLECSNCREIAAGTSLAVREIDGASNNSVDNVRELIESFRTLPAPGSKYKVYIIDEVHMLSISAFNALLKSLEEPPPNTVFVLATTEPHKIPDTVLSRCQRHDLRALPVATISECLAEIANRESFIIDSSALKIIAKLAEGSMRDAQTLLERVRAYGGESITAQEVSVILGAVDIQLLYALGEKVIAQDVEGALSLVHDAFETGGDESIFLREFVGFFRDLHVAALADTQNGRVVGLTKDEQAELVALTENNIDREDLADLADMAREGADKALRSSFPRYALESLVIRMAARPRVKDLGKMVGRLREMVTAEKKKPKEQPIGHSKPTEATIVSSAALTPKITHAPKIIHGKIDSSPKKKVRKPEAIPSRSEALQSADTGQLSEQQYNMADFVSFAHKQGGEIIGEMLRCVTTVAFQDGVLKIEGPEFQIGSLQQEDTRARLLVLLEEFSKCSSWRIETKVVSDGGLRTDKSLKAVERKEVESKLLEQREKMLRDNTVKRVIKTFPGSKIERIRLKRNAV